jgi:hypothetical protein
MLSLLNEISVHLTGITNPEIISGEASFMRESSAVGPFENKSDYTKVDVFPGALPLYTEKRKRVRYELPGKQINKKKKSFISIERFFFL